MSSHHIVRDEQEPAIIISGTGDIDFDVLGGYLEWSPTVVSTQSTVTTILARGIKIDVAVVQEELVEDFREIMQEQQPVKILGINDDDFVGSGLEFLRSNNHSACNIFADIDLDLRAVQPFSKDMDITFVNGHTKTLLYSKYEFRKWLGKGQVLRIQAPDHAEIVVEGLMRSEGENYKVKEDQVCSVRSDKIPMLITFDPTLK